MLQVRGHGRQVVAYFQANKDDIVVFDLGAIAALIVMCAKKPKSIVNNGEKIVDSNVKPK